MVNQKEKTSFTEEMGFEFVVDEREHVEVTMEMSPRVTQPFGFLHGGVTIALLETAASRGAENMADLETELPFGIEARIRHKKSARSGVIRGVATLDHVEKNKQIWNVAAYDDEGDVISDGIFITKIVTREYFAQKQLAMKEARSQRES